MTACTATAWCGGYLDAPIPVEVRPQPAEFVSGGMTWNLCPQIAGYYGIQRALQAGLEIRSWVFDAALAYDYIPEMDLHVRMLWLPSDENEPLRNSEYVDLGVGVYPSHAFVSFDEAGNNLDPRPGLRPTLKISVGKYWMPIPNLPWGLDVNLILERYIQGHAPGLTQPDLVTASFALFYTLRPRP